MFVTLFSIYWRFHNYGRKKKKPIAIHLGVGVRYFKGVGLERRSHI